MQVEQEWSRFNYKGAYNASRKAQGWGIAGIVTGTIAMLIIIILYVVVRVVAAIRYPDIKLLWQLTEVQSCMQSWLIH